MNRAEKRRQQKLAKKAAGRSPVQRTNASHPSLNEAVQLHSAGRLPEAEALYQQILRDDPRQPDALHLLGMLSHQVGNSDAALELINRALAVRPDFADACSNLGIILKRLGRLDEAVASYRKAISFKPDNADAHYNLGLALDELGAHEEAAASYERAVVIKPGFAEAHSNLGNVLRTLGKQEEAVTRYDRAIALKPGYIDAHYNRGNTLQALGQLDEALLSYHKATALKPDYAEAHYNAGSALQALSRFDEAVDCYLKAIAIKPDYAEAHANLGTALQAVGKLDDAVAKYRDALAIRPDLTKVHSNLVFTLNHIRTQTPADILEEARRYGDKVAAGARPFSHHANPPVPDRRLRIGFVSGDLCEHAVGYFLVSLLPEINTQSIELYAYSASPEEDQMTALLKARFAGWRRVTDMSDQELAEKIRNDAIDILVDLSGHTAHNRLPVFAWKPAPVQVTWIGYPGTSGIREMDYILGDRWMLPTEEENHFVETPYRLADCNACFTPPDVDLDVAVLPAEKNGYVTFGCFNNLTKVNDLVVSCWAKILQAVPDSRLFLKANQLSTQTVQKDMLSRFSDCGISADRLILEGPSPREAYLACYNRVDICLDPFPYAGGTTSVEALWMGVPVLTLKGDRFISHIGESIAHNIEMDDWIAASPEAYIDLAKSHASDLPALSALRTGLRERLVASPMCDAPRFALSLETAFRDMWTQCCAR